MPKIEGLDYLRDIWNTWGKCGSTGQSLVAFNSRDIQSLVDVEHLPPREGRVLRLMSAAFVHYYYHAKDPFIIPPWDGS